MKKAEEILKEATKEGAKQGFKPPESFALGVLIAKYDMLRRDYLELKKQFETLNNKL